MAANTEPLEKTSRRGRFANLSSKNRSAANAKARELGVYNV